MIKNIMLTINFIIAIASFFAIISFLVEKSFGWAWLCVIPTIYGILNVIAIDSEEEEEY